MQEQYLEPDNTSIAAYETSGHHPFLWIIKIALEQSSAMQLDFNTSCVSEINVNREYAQAPRGE